MPLDVEPPAPPELEYVDPNQYDDASVADGPDVDYRRQELQEFLEAGGWEEAFDRWRADAALSEREFAIATDMDLFSQFDFFWDDFADRVGYHAPGIPEDWQERSYHPELDTWGTVSAINAGLTEFGQIVCEHLKESYVDWEAEYEPPEDLPDF
ncbi:hypothetical protein Halru_1503 [Halovivax ruber XH-70]|uniref:DUF7992 domain-containing protein n=1 Tax=Halovivax ruber (strain DSM 18193 / JCM 13892 / XH-70) TaxID=797302 RepID=L0ID06_HALRX|nr:hypothetical protein [Halovivax ruber]AGB16111.1 hypothetical protein Halru_1503 [Halovivax ruber XH-70]